jgi:hypothetical protein
MLLKAIQQQTYSARSELIGDGSASNSRTIENATGTSAWSYVRISNSSSTSESRRQQGPASKQRLD